jgi:hypothetical protein
MNHTQVKFNRSILDNKLKDYTFVLDDQARPNLDPDQVLGIANEEANGKVWVYGCWLTGLNPKLIRKTNEAWYSRSDCSLNLSKTRKLHCSFHHVTGESKYFSFGKMSRYKEFWEYLFRNQDQIFIDAIEGSRSHVEVPNLITGLTDAIDFLNMVPKNKGYENGVDLFEVKRIDEERHQMKVELDRIETQNEILETMIEDWEMLKANHCWCDMKAVLLSKDKKEYNDAIEMFEKSRVKNLKKLIITLESRNKSLFKSNKISDYEKRKANEKHIDEANQIIKFGGVLPRLGTEKYYKNYCWKDFEEYYSEVHQANERSYWSYDDVKAYVAISKNTYENKYIDNQYFKKWAESKALCHYCFNNPQPSPINTDDFIGKDDELEKLRQKSLTLSRIPGTKFYKNDENKNILYYDPLKNFTEQADKFLSCLTERLEDISHTEVTKKFNLLELIEDRKFKIINKAKKLVNNDVDEFQKNKDAVLSAVNKMCDDKDCWVEWGALFADSINEPARVLLCKIVNEVGSDEFVDILVNKLKREGRIRTLGGYIFRYFKRTSLRGLWHDVDVRAEERSIDPNPTLFKFERRINAPKLRPLIKEKYQGTATHNLLPFFEDISYTAMKKLLDDVYGLDLIPMLKEVFKKNTTFVYAAYAAHVVNVRMNFISVNNDLLDLKKKGWNRAKFNQLRAYLSLSLKKTPIVKYNKRIQSYFDYIPDFEPVIAESTDDEGIYSIEKYIPTVKYIVNPNLDYKMVRRFNHILTELRYKKEPGKYVLPEIGNAVEYFNKFQIEDATRLSNLIKY